MAYQILSEGAGLYFQFSGDVHFDEIVEANQAGWEHQDFPTSSYQVWDMVNVNYITSDIEDAVFNAKADNAAFNHMPQMKIALVATNDELRAASRLYLENVDHQIVQGELFETIEEARNWLKEVLGK